jgi:hypothetical protein
MNAGVATTSTAIAYAVFRGSTNVTVLRSWECTESMPLRPLVARPRK